MEKYSYYHGYISGVQIVEKIEKNFDEEDREISVPSPTAYNRAYLASFLRHSAQIQPSAGLQIRSGRYMEFRTSPLKKKSLFLNPEQYQNLKFK